MGNAELYKLNTENPRVKILMKIAIELADSYFKETKQKVPIRI